MEDDQVALGLGDPGAHRRALAPVLRVLDEPDARLRRGVLAQQLARAVARAVLDHQYLDRGDALPAGRRGEHAVDRLADEETLVVDGDDDREREHG